MGKQGLAKGVGKDGKAPLLPKSAPGVIPTVTARPQRAAACPRNSAQIIAGHCGIIGCDKPLKGPNILGQDVPNISCAGHYCTFVKNYSYMPAGVFQQQVNDDVPPGFQ